MVFRDSSISDSDSTLLFSIFGKPKHFTETNDFFPFWYLEEPNVKELKTFVSKLAQYLRTKKEQLIEKNKFDELFAAARARVAAFDAQIASLQKNIADAVLKAPVGGIVTSKLVDEGELIAPRTAVVVITDLDHAWGNVYVDEPVVPRLRLGQQPP